MNAWPEDHGEAIRRYLQQLQLRSRDTVNVYGYVLRGFQRFMQQRGDDAVSMTAFQAWLRNRTDHWARPLVLHHARIVDRFLDFLVSEAAIRLNPLAELRTSYGQRSSVPIVRALLADDTDAALASLRPLPRFASFLGVEMRKHIEVMHAAGYRYETQAGRLLRFDRFLQGRPDLEGQSPRTMLQQWALRCQTLHQSWECEELGRDLAGMWRRFDPTVHLPPMDRRLRSQVRQQQRQPYIFTPEQLRLLFDTARSFPSPRAPLRPQVLYMMLVLAGCAGLRLGELVRLDLGDVHLDVGELDIRETKFFKSRTLPLSSSVMAALREYLDARRRAGASQDERSGLFWHEQAAARYSRVMAEKLLVRVMRRAELKPKAGRCGPRVHDMRHAFVVYRMLAWYRQGINPQARLPYLATYLGHKDINSTLVYLTVTQDLLQQASDRFREFASHRLHTAWEVQP